MAKGSNKKVKSLVSIPVKFSGLSVGALTFKIGLSFDRSFMPDLNEVSKIFCNHRLNGRLQLGLRDEAPSQGKLFKDCDFEVEGCFDSKKLSVSTDTVSIGATFIKSDMKFEDIDKFPGGSGRLVIEQVTDIPANAPKENHKGDDEDDDEPKHVPGSLKFEGDPRKVLMTQIFKTKKVILKAFDEAGITNVGELNDYTDTGKKIADLKGMGHGPASVVAETMINFWSDNPQKPDAKKK